MKKCDQSYDHRVHEPSLASRGPQVKLDHLFRVRGNKKKYSKPTSRLKHGISIDKLGL